MQLVNGCNFVIFAKSNTIEQIVKSVANRHQILAKVKIEIVDVVEEWGGVKNFYIQIFRKFFLKSQIKNSTHGGI